MDGLLIFDFRYVIGSTETIDIMDTIRYNIYELYKK